MNRYFTFAALVLFSAVPGALCAATAPNHASQLSSLQSQYLAAGTPEQRREFVGELKALGRNSDIDAGALNAAVAAMLPAAASTWEAEELLAIGAGGATETFGAVKTGCSVSAITDLGGAATV